MPHEIEASLVAAGVKQSVAWADRLAWAALTYTLAASVSNVFGTGSLGFLGALLPPGGAVLGLVILTAAHVFVARHIIRSCADSWRHLEADERSALFDDIVRTGGLMTKGTDAYRDAITERGYVLELKTSPSEPSTWLHIVLISLVLLSVVHLEFNLLAVSQICLGIVIVLLNWTIGASWLLCLGDLGTRGDRSRYFIDGTARPRSISHVSGFVVSEHVGFPTFLRGSILEAAVVAMLLWFVLLIPFGTIWVGIYLVRTVIDTQ